MLFDILNTWRQLRLPRSDAHPGVGGTGQGRQRPSGGHRPSTGAQGGARGEAPFGISSSFSVVDVGGKLSMFSAVFVRFCSRNVRLHSQRTAGFREKTGGGRMTRTFPDIHGHFRTSRTGPGCSWHLSARAYKVYLCTRLSYNAAPCLISALASKKRAN